MIPVWRFSIYTASIDEVFQLLSEYLPGCRFAQNIFYRSQYDWFNYHVILIGKSKSLPSKQIPFYRENVV